MINNVEGKALQPISSEGNITTIIARDLPEAWFLSLKCIMRTGHEYLVKRGSFEGDTYRKELDAVAIQIFHPGSQPMVPDVPLGVPPPCTMDYVEQYLPYLMTSDKGQNDLYTYGEDIDKQLPKLIEMLKSAGESTNQACMAIGSAASMDLEHPQCLRVIDTRIRNGRLHFHVYFRSWDLWSGFPANLAGIQILKEYVASEVGVEDGYLFAYSKGLHLYSTHWELARMVLRR